MQKKPYSKVKSIQIPLYGGRLVMIFSNCSEKIKKTIPNWDKETDEIYGSAWYINYKDRQGFAMILNFDSDRAKITHGTIAHEAVHLAHYIADERGIKLDLNNDEPITYLVGWIVDEVYDFIKKSNLEVSIKM